jgi:glucarate dehydratase
MKIRSMSVTPVAVPDAPLLNAFGVHEPLALRAIIELETEDGITGISETYGDEDTLKSLSRIRDLVVGQDAFRVNLVAAAIGDRLSSLTEELLATLIGAIEVACLDIQGKALGRPVVDLLGGPLRDEVPFAAYLFYKFEHVDQHAPLPELTSEVLSPEALVEEAKALVDTYGFGTLKLKGGVLPPDVECETIFALRDTFPEHPLRIDPNTAWTFETAQSAARRLEGVLEYLEDPVAGVDGMAAIARDTAIPLATNMAVEVLSDIPDAIRLDACHIVLADHHSWGGLYRSRELARVCSTWGLQLGMHSNTHLGISLAAMVHLGASLEDVPFSFDTHYPWQSEDVLLDGKLPIDQGTVRLPDGPGLGVAIDSDQLARMHERYMSSGKRGRDDIAEMRKYDPKWLGVVPRF